MQTDAKNQSLDALQGGWSAVLIFNNGAEVPVAQAKGGELTVDDNEYRAKLGANTVAATIEVNTSRTPKQIDFTYKEGPQKGKKIKGIYKLSGDELTVCRGLTDREPRPLEFAAPLNSGLLLVTWRKSKTVVSAKTKAIEEELKRFNATWHFVSVEAEGMQIPKQAFEKDTLILKGKRFATFMGGKLVHGDFKIDPLARPKTIDIIFTEGPGKGHIQRGIYEPQRRHAEDLRRNARQAASHRFRQPARQRAYHPGAQTAETLTFADSLVSRGVE